jgi:hypothetical protein
MSGNSNNNNLTKYKWKEIDPVLYEMAVDRVKSIESRVEQQFKD